MEWYDDGQPGLAAKRNGVTLRIVGSDITRTYLRIQDDRGREYVIFDPQPLSLAPAGQAIAALKRFFGKAPPAKTAEATIEEKIHVKIEEVRLLAAKQCVARHKNPKDINQIRNQLFNQLMNGDR